MGVIGNQMFRRLRIFCCTKHNVTCNLNWVKKLIIIGLIICIFVYIFLSNFLLSRQAPILGWGPNTSRDLKVYLQPNKNTTIIHPPQICDEKFLMLITVLTSPDHFLQRQTIRETYGNFEDFNFHLFHKMHEKSKGKYENIIYEKWKDYVTPNRIYSSNKSPDELKFSAKLIFLLGLSDDLDTENEIIEESQRHKDILQEDFIDSYNNLTLKTGMMLKWVTNNCYDKVKYVLKFDDDSFLNVPNLFQTLLGGTVPIYEATKSQYEHYSSTHHENKLNYGEKLIVGFKHENVRPIADTRSKWYIPRYMYAADKFPAYVGGPGYLLSVDAVKILYNTSLSIPLLHIEDIYYTGIVAKAANLCPHHSPLFYYSKLEDKCAFKGLIMQSEFSVNDIRNAYAFVKNDIFCE